MALGPFTDTSPPEQFVASGGTFTPFTGVSIADTIGQTEGVLVDLLATGSAQLNDSNLGTLSDPGGGGTFSTVPFPNFTETGLVTGSPTFASTVFSRLNYVAQTLANGQSAEIATFAFVDDMGGTGPYLADTKNPGIIDVVTAPAVTNTVANQPDASTSTIRPFATVNLTDADFNFSGTDTATITITDGGVATDADGLLTGPGLSKTGVGTYAITNPDLPFNIAGELNQLIFTPTVLGTGVSKTVNFELDATDTRAKLTSKDTTTSVLASGPTPTPVPPSIAGTIAGQTVAPGNVIDPFSAVTISDTNIGPTDAVLITVTDSTGNPTDGNGTLTGAGLTETSPGVYTLAAATPATITTELDNLTFHPTGTGTPPTTTSFKLAVTDPGAVKTAIDTTTTVIDQPTTTGGGGGMVTPNFHIADQTTGHTNDTAGQAYTGPVPGLVDDLILLTTDNINVTADIPNVFIHTGSGNDGIDVSKVNGTNILDGSTGTNFLVGGTGNDTFFVDDRNAASDIFDTIQGFHSGDQATVWGITPSNFTITPGDNVLPTAPGLDFAITAAGKPNANVNIPGYSTADLSNGRLSMTFGTSPDTPGLPGSAYMLITAT